MYAAIVFLTVVWAKPSVRPGTATLVVSEGSYSLYLLHMPVGMIIINGLQPSLGFTLALIIALVTLTGACWISYTYVEKSSQAVGRLLIRRMSQVERRKRALVHGSGAHGVSGPNSHIS